MTPDSPKPPLRLWCFALVAAPVAAACVVAACSAISNNAHVSRVPVGRATEVWLLTRAVLADVSNNPHVNGRLRRSRVYEILRQGQEPLRGVAAKPVVTFGSAVALRAAVTSHRLAGGTRSVLYDPEAWPFTPPGEQRDPLAAATRAAAAAHAAGLRLFVAPALDLIEVLEPRRSTPRWRRFLVGRLAARLAPVSDVLELQAQSLERDTDTYAAFVQAAAAQARAANPRIQVLAGLSTNPPGAPIARRQLTRAIEATRSVVNGYWLNVPGPGPRCPNCNAGRIDIAIQTLLALH